MCEILTPRLDPSPIMPNAERQSKRPIHRTPASVSRGSESGGNMQ
jgi:hypothetical protein